MVGACLFIHTVIVCYLLVYLKQFKSYISSSCLFLYLMHDSHFDHIHVHVTGVNKHSNHFTFSLITYILHQAINFKPSMFTSCYICQKLCMNLGHCGQTLLFHLRTTMVIYENCFMEQRMWMVRCVHLCVSVNEDYPKRKCKQ